jgi:retron-type reverse transcriptase
MDREEIKKRFMRLKGKEDLLALLNEVKADELGDKSYPFTMKQINFYCNPTSIPNSRRYHDFYIAKKSGGKRHISAPVNGLKSIQTYLNIILQAVYEPSPWAMGFTQNRSVVNNAQMHIGQNYIFNLDIKDFFPSISQARVWGRLQVRPFNLDSKLAGVVAGLCCMKVVTEESEKYILPQGAPTSPLLTNAICDKLDYKLSKLARRYGLNYSRYADDITFSSMHNVYQANSPFMQMLYQIIQEQGFQVNEAKTRLQKKGSRQEVTGLIVSEKVNVTRKYTEDIRNVLYMWQRYGLVAVYRKFVRHYKKEKGHVKKGEPVLENVLVGKLDYLKMVKGENDSTYLKLRNKYDMLMNQSKEATDDAFTYLDTHTIVDFEKILGTKMEFKKSKKGKSFASFMLDGDIKIVSISKGAEGMSPSMLLISLCENSEKERFYFIHRPIGKKAKEKEKAESIPLSLDELLEKLCNSNFDLSVL